MATPSFDFSRNRDNLLKLCDDIQEAIEIQKTRIENQVMKSSEEVKQWFERQSRKDITSYLEIILQNIDLAKKDVWDKIKQIEDYLTTTRKDLQGLNNNGEIESNHSEKLHKELQEIRSILDTYTMEEEIDLFADIPTYVLKFDLTLPSFIVDDMNTTTHPANIAVAVINNSPIIEEPTKPKKNLGWSQHFIHTSYKVDLLASDGDNIFYTSYSKCYSDVIAYRFLDDNNTPDYMRDWKQSQIVDMVGWDRINSFICATCDAIYTVTFQNNSFKIHSEITGKWSYVRVATNSNELWVWENSDTDDFEGISIYDDDFRLIREIDFDDRRFRPFTGGSTSFCLTDQLTASICERTTKGQKRCQVNFNGLGMMMNFKTVYVDIIEGNSMIRTDGDNNFFITTGGRKLYMVSPDMNIDILTLTNESDAIAVVNSDCVVMSGGTCTLEVWTYGILL